MSHSESEALSLFPLDPRCFLQTNLVWTPNADGVPSLHRQQIWARFPGPVETVGVSFKFSAPVGRVRVEVAENEAGSSWRLLAEAELAQSPQTVAWPAATLANIRINVVDPKQPSFPNAYYFERIELQLGAAGTSTWKVAPPTVAAQPLADLSPARVEPLAGPAGIHANQQLGLAHDRPRTDRIEVRADAAAVEFRSPLLRLTFSRRHALVTHLGWDTHGAARQEANLLSVGNTQGAFACAVRDGRRVAGEDAGGTFAWDGRQVRYSGIRPVPELEWHTTYRLKERGFSVELAWNCSREFHASELAALRLPFDLYQSVVNVLAAPDMSGPAGLVTLPLVINAPNHGVMRVTARDQARVLARIIPLRVQGELWLDFMPGACPLPSGMFAMPAGQGSVTLDFELTRIFPFGSPAGESIFSWWEMPPFYSFAERESILGPLTNAWLNGLAFRPDLGRFANNSVADSAALCASYYADIAAYTPPLADGLDSRDFIRIAAEQMFRDHNSSIYSNWRHFPMAATSPLDCAWLYVASTGDWAWAQQWRDVIRSYAAVLGRLEHENSGLVASSQSGIPEEADALDAAGNMQCQWADSLRSGHLESYVNAHAYRALNRAGDLLERLAAGEEASRARAQAERLRSNFMGVFHDRESGQIMQWVARDGRRFGFQSHMHLGAAVALGLVPTEVARELLTAYLGRLERSGFTRYEWGLPMVLEPIPAVCHNNWKGKGIEPDGSDQFGVYQNGAVHSHQTWYLLQALYRTGLRSEANRLFERMTPLVRQGGLCGGLHSGVDWRHPRDGRPTGYEGLLAEQFHFLLAAITGYLGCELEIDGLVFHGPANSRIRQLKPDFAGRRSVHPAEVL